MIDNLPITLVNWLNYKKENFSEIFVFEDFNKNIVFLLKKDIEIGWYEKLRFWIINLQMALVNWLKDFKIRKKKIWSEKERDYVFWCFDTEMDYVRFERLIIDLPITLVDWLMILWSGKKEKWQIIFWWKFIDKVSFIFLTFYTVLKILKNSIFK